MYLRLRHATLGSVTLRPTPRAAPRREGRVNIHRPRLQMLRFRAETAKALTTVFAGFAFTTTSFPNIILFPALVAGFTFVLILHNPGRVKIPVDFTSPAPISASVPITFPHTDFLRSICVASASASAPLLIAAPEAFIALIAFIAFMGAMLASQTLEKGSARGAPKQC